MSEQQLTLEEIDGLFQRHLEPIQNDIRKLQADVSQIQTDVTKLQADTTEVKSLTNDISKHMNGILSATNQLDNIKTRLLTLETYCTVNCDSKKSYEDVLNENLSQ